MMNRMSFSETIFLFFLALIIFGPKKLPEIARQIGKALNEFRRASNEFKAQIEHEISNLEVEKKAQTVLPPVASAPEGTAARTLEAAPAWTGEGDPAPAQQEAAQAPVDPPAEAGPVESPATLAASTEEHPGPVGQGEPATEALPAPEPVTSSTSQESHA
jgi:sec-independent protein translocase protein TatB